MKREEALDWIKARKEHYELDDNCQLLAEALNLAIKSLENEEKLLKENRALKNRCRVQTQGLLCSFCPLECEQRAGDYRGK